MDKDSVTFAIENVCYEIRSLPAPSPSDEQCRICSEAIAAQARNATLDEIERQTNSIFCPPFAVSCPFDKVIRSLRTKEQP